MNFYEYPDSVAQVTKRLGVTRENVYAFLRSHWAKVNDIGAAHMLWEEQWINARRPFYRVWPSVLPLLVKLDVAKVPASACKLPEGINALWVMLPAGNRLAGSHDLIGLFIGSIPSSKGPGTVVGTFDGKVDHAFGVDVPLVDIWFFEQSEDNLQQVLDNLRLAAPLDAGDYRDRAIALATTLCLLADNQELISPVLLARDDKPGLSPADIGRLTAKAHRRGRIGWDVGKHLEVIPHYRRPHPALVWTGQGRKIPKVVLRSGSLVHRSKLSEIPTGYLEP